MVDMYLFTLEHNMQSPIAEPFPTSSQRSQSSRDCGIFAFVTWIVSLAASVYVHKPARAALAETVLFLYLTCNLALLGRL